MATREERKAETEKIRQADALLGDFTREDWLHHCRMEPVRPFRVQGDQVEVCVRETGELIEVLSEAAYTKRLEECLA